MNPRSKFGNRCRRGGAVLVLALGLGSLTGCSLFTDEGPCTLIGCESGLMVRLDGAPAPVSLRVHLPDGTVLERECLPEHCARGAFFAGVRAPTVEIDVTVNGNTQTVSVPLTYRAHYPNGESCGDPCLVTGVHLKLPEGQLVAA